MYQRRRIRCRKFRLQLAGSMRKHQRQQGEEREKRHRNTPAIPTTTEAIAVNKPETFTGTGGIPGVTTADSVLGAKNPSISAERPGAEGSARSRPRQSRKHHAPFVLGGREDGGEASTKNHMSLFFVIPVLNFVPTSTGFRLQAEPAGKSCVRVDACWKGNTSRSVWCVTLHGSRMCASFRVTLRILGWHHSNSPTATQGGPTKSLNIPNSKGPVASAIRPNQVADGCDEHEGFSLILKTLASSTESNSDSFLIGAKREKRGRRIPGFVTRRRYLSSSCPHRPPACTTDTRPETETK